MTNRTIDVQPILVFSNPKAILDFGGNKLKNMNVIKVDILSDIIKKSDVEFIGQEAIDQIFLLLYNLKNNKD
jgi:hypothetical protein